MDQATEVALFKYQVIAPLLGRGDGETLAARIRSIAARDHPHPSRGPIRIAPGTVEEWYLSYRREGFPGLLPKSRKDRGKSRAIDDVLAEEVVLLAKERPTLDGPGILAELQARGVFLAAGKPSLSTLYRFLRAQGLADRKAPSRIDHRAFAFELAGDCWQADVMYGPSLPTADGRRQKVYLLAILDDASRLIVHAQFYFEQHLRAFKDCLKQGFQKRGLCRLLYVDNGRIFRSRSVLVLCARLGIQIVHSRPYKPQGRAKLERWFGTVRRRFLARLEIHRLSGLDELNRLLFAWVEGEYHLTPHRGIDGETPIDRFLRKAGGLRPLPPEVDLDFLFLEETTRRVAKDGTLTLRGRTFEAGPLFVGRRVVLRFDPFDLRRILLVDAEEHVEIFPVDLSVNRRIRRHPDPQPATGLPGQKLRSLTDLADRRDANDEEEDGDACAC